MHAGIADRLARDGWPSAYTPTRLGEKYLDRPAPAYWPGAVSQHLLGPERHASRLPAALAGVALAFAVFALVRRARGPAAAGFAAALAIGTPLLALLFRSALPAALPTALSAAGFLCAAASIGGPSRSHRLELAAALLLALAAATGGVPAVAPPLAALALFALVRPRESAANRSAATGFRRWLPAAAGIATAGALIAPAFVLHGTGAAWGYVRPDVAEEIPKTDEQLAKADRPDDRNAHDRDVEAVLMGAFPWIVLLPGALFAAAWGRKWTPPEARATTADPPANADTNATSEPPTTTTTRVWSGFDLLCLLWGGASVAAVLVLGDRWHHDPFGALLPLAVCTGLYIDRKRTEGWTFADSVLLVAGLALAAIAYRDLRGGGRLLDAWSYFAPSPDRVVAGFGWPLRLAALGAVGVAAGALVLRRLPCALGVAIAAVSIGWTVAVVHVLPPRPAAIGSPAAAASGTAIVQPSRRMSMSQIASPTETRKPTARTIRRFRTMRDRGIADRARLSSARATIRSSAARARSPRTESAVRPRYRAAARSSFPSARHACRNSSWSPADSHFSRTASHIGASDGGSSRDSA
jgi:hypothetical protein